MSVLGKFVQTSSEKKEKVLDYSDWLAAGENLTNLAFTITPLGNSTQNAPVVVTWTINTPANTANIFISGGDNGSQYKIVVTATTSATQIKQDEILLDIKDY
jgi:hypothetical protein